MRIKFLLFIIGVAFQFESCQNNAPGCFIDLSEVKSDSVVKIVLYGLELDMEDGKWNNRKIDSVITNPGTVITWPMKYQTRFIANFIILDNNNQIVARSNNFIFSKGPLRIEKDEYIEVLNSPGILKNAITFVVEGGENELYRDKGFLAPPRMELPKDFMLRIKDHKNIITKDSLLSYKWREYERRVLNDVKKYSDSYYTVYRLLAICDILSNSTLLKCFNQLSVNLKNTDEGKSLIRYIQNSTTLYLGSKIPTFSMEDQAGNRIESSELFLEKYYLLEFWASWCVPCRKQIDELDRIYNRIDTSKIQIVTLSIDKNYDDWLKSTIKERIRWPNYIQLNNGHKISSLFNLNFIPQNIIVNKQEQIVYKNLTFSEFTNFLRQNKLFLDDAKLQTSVNIPVGSE